MEQPAAGWDPGTPNLDTSWNENMEAGGITSVRPRSTPGRQGTFLGGKVDIAAVEGRYGLQEGRNLCKLWRTQILKFWTTALQPAPTNLPSGIACIFGLGV